MNLTVYVKRLFDFINCLVDLILGKVRRLVLPLSFIWVLHSPVYSLGSFTFTVTCYFLLKKVKIAWLLPAVSNNLIKISAILSHKLTIVWNILYSINLEYWGYLKWILLSRVISATSALIFRVRLVVVGYSYDDFWQFRSPYIYFNISRVNC